jgi:hypothetical protein
MPLTLFQALSGQHAGKGLSCANGLVGFEMGRHCEAMLFGFILPLIGFLWLAKPRLSL